MSGSIKVLFDVHGYESEVRPGVMIDFSLGEHFGLDFTVAWISPGKMNVQMSSYNWMIGKSSFIGKPGNLVQR